MATFTLHRNNSPLEQQNIDNDLAAGRQGSFATFALCCSGSSEFKMEISEDICLSRIYNDGVIMSLFEISNLVKHYMLFHSKSIFSPIFCASLCCLKIRIFM